MKPTTIFLKFRVFTTRLPEAVSRKKRRGIKDPEILSAIKYHTTAKPNMTLLEKLLYVSDFTEPTRSYPDIDFYRKTAREDIDRTVALGLKMEYRRAAKKQQSGLLPLHSSGEVLSEILRKERTETNNERRKTQ